MRTKLPSKPRAKGTLPPEIQDNEVQPEDITRTVLGITIDSKHVLFTGVFERCEIQRVVETSRNYGQEVYEIAFTVWLEWVKSYATMANIL